MKSKKKLALFFCSMMIITGVISTPNAVAVSPEIQKKQEEVEKIKQKMTAVLKSADSEIDRRMSLRIHPWESEAKKSDELLVSEVSKVSMLLLESVRELANLKGRDEEDRIAIAATIDSCKVWLAKITESVRLAHERAVGFTTPTGSVRLARERAAGVTTILGELDKLKVNLTSLQRVAFFKKDEKKAIGASLCAHSAASVSGGGALTQRPAAVAVPSPLRAVTTASACGGDALPTFAYCFVGDVFTLRVAPEEALKRLLAEVEKFVAKLGVISASPVRVRGEQELTKQIAAAVAECNKQNVNSIECQNMARDLGCRIINSVGPTAADTKLLYALSTVPGVNNRFSMDGSRWWVCDWRGSSGAFGLLQEDATELAAFEQLEKKLNTGSLPASAVGAARNLCKLWEEVEKFVADWEANKPDRISASGAWVQKEKELAEQISVAIAECGKENVLTEYCRQMAQYLCRLIVQRGIHTPTDNVLLYTLFSVPNVDNPFICDCWDDGTSFGCGRWDGGSERCLDAE
ncbi:hypothetical protein FACS189481_5020 [Clostridia bacterium]|nr:hypothetical protein FACS189481_5020 [Clostridia bacterium]